MNKNTNPFAPKACPRCGSPDPGNFEPYKPANSVDGMHFWICHHCTAHFAVCEEHAFPVAYDEDDVYCDECGE
jgi:hypothetical protein